MIEGTVGHCDRVIQSEHLRHVHSLARIVLLTVGLPYLRIGLHYDPRLGSVHPGLPRALSAHHLAVFVLLSVLPEVPDVAFVVLGEPVVGLFDELVTFPSPVIDHHALYSHYLSSVVGDAHLVALSFPLVDEGGARLHGEVLVVYLGGELVGIDVGSVRFLLLRGGGAGASRHEHKHRAYDRTQQSDPSHKCSAPFSKAVASTCASFAHHGLQFLEHVSSASVPLDSEIALRT